jgi:hypothetical protein
MKTRKTIITVKSGSLSEFIILCRKMLPRTIKTRSTGMIYLLMKIIFLFVLSLNSYSQSKPDSTATQIPRIIIKVDMKDGTSIFGILLKEEQDKIILVNENVGEITIRKERISSTKIVDQSSFKKGEYWFENPNATRYLFGPSAFQLKKGEGYYQNAYLILNMFNVGITNNISIGAGFELFSTFGGGTPIFCLTPKIGFPVTEKLNFGAGALYINVLNLSANENESLISLGPSGIGIGYGVGTYGTRENNITFGIGYGWGKNGFMHKPILTLSFMTRASKRIAFVSENWIIPNEEFDKVKYNALVSYGLRFMGEKLTIDFAFINNKNIVKGIFIGIPYIDFVVKFGK